MRFGDRDVSVWSVLMLICGILMVSSIFFNMVAVETLGKVVAISGLDMLNGGFNLGFGTIGTDSMTIYHYIPLFVAAMGVLSILVSIWTFSPRGDGRRTMTIMSVILTITLFLSVIFQMVGTSVDLFTGSNREMLIALGSEFRPMFGTYLAMLSTFVCGMSSTFLMRKQMGN